MPSSWSPEDETLLFTVVPVQEPGAPGAIWTYTRARGTAAPFGGVQAAAQSPEFSPDGRWVAYSDRPQRGHFIQPFPATGARYQLPRLVLAGVTDFGSHPFWSPDGTRLFFAPTGGRLAAVTLTTPPAITFGEPDGGAPEVRGRRRPDPPRNYDVTPDGRFIGLMAPEQAADSTAPEEIRIVLNWTEELKRLVPRP